MKAFLKWFEDQISAVPPLPFDMSSAIAAMAHFWNADSRVWIFLGCCRDRDLFSPTYWFKICDLYDAGQFELARPWVITFNIAFHLTHLQHCGQTPEKRQLVDVITWTANCDNTLANKPCKQLIAYGNHLGNAYYYARSSRVSLAHCLIVTAAAYLNRNEESYYEFWGPYISIIIDWIKPRLLKIN
jgi:hypothetical protein